MSGGQKKLSHYFTLSWYPQTEQLLQLSQHHVLSSIGVSSRQNPWKGSAQTLQ